MTRTVVSPDGVPLRYESHGDGPVDLVLVHGWSCDRSYWAGQFEPFSHDYRVTALDLAGHGGSGVGRETWSIRAFGDDVAAVVTDLGAGRVILAGHSMGGDVIVEAARRLHGRVAGLIWVDVYKKLGTARTAEQLAAFLGPFRTAFAETTIEFVRGMFPPGADHNLVERVAADMAAAPPGIALAAMESAMTYDREVTRVLPELKLPVIAINPDDRPTDLESMARYGVDVVLMPGVGHYPMLEAPAVFNTFLQRAIERVLQQSAAGT